MDWALENWFWILIFVFFIAIHLFGHGGHGGHGGHRHHQTGNENEKAEDRTVNKNSNEHQH